MQVKDVSFGQFLKAVGRGTAVFQCGPIKSRALSANRVFQADLYSAYANYGYCDAPSEHSHLTVDVAPVSPLRRYLRPNFMAKADLLGPFTPLPPDLAFVGYEMAQNWQIAMSHNKHLVFHASSVADASGRTLFMPGASGSGKSTLGAAMGFRGWRFLGDEFAFFDLETGQFCPFPRPISLKNESIKVMSDWAPTGRMSRLYEKTIKGTVCYLEPPEHVFNAEPAPHHMPAFCIFPKFTAGGEVKLRRMRPAEAAIQMSNACVNYDRIGKAAFEQVMGWATNLPVYSLSFPSLDAAIAEIQNLYEASDAD